LTKDGLEEYLEKMTTLLMSIDVQAESIIAIIIDKMAKYLEWRRLIFLADCIV
jgi:hypothetical protein